VLRARNDVTPWVPSHGFAETEPESAATNTPARAIFLDVKKGLTAGVTWVLIALSAGADGQDTAAPIESQPVLIFTLAVDSETVGTWNASLVTALVTGVVGEARRSAHAKFLSSLEAVSDNDGQALEFMRPLVCLDSVCRQPVRLPAPLSQEALIAELRKSPGQAARVVEMKVIFDGRFFQVPTVLYEASLDPEGRILRSRTTGGTYITTYSKSLHAQEMREHVIDEQFSGKPGSKAARVHYWLGGSDPRLQRELAQSIRMIAALWSTRMSSDAPATLSDDPAQRAGLPLVKQVVAHDKPVCKTLHGAFPVVKDLGDHFWLALPGSAGKKLPHAFFIERRCGYDY
jgi:hypothetical protein